MSLIVVGSVAFDALESPFGKTDKILGGAATFISFAASHYLKDIKLVSVVGEDFPQAYINLLTDRNVQIDGLQIKKGEKTFFWSGKYHNDMNSRDTLITELNVLENFDPIIPESYQGAEYLLLGNLSPIVQRQVIEKLTTRPKLIVMDTMNFWMDIMMEELVKTINLVDLLCINDAEARQLTGEYSLKRAAAKILTMGPSIVVIKKGEHGALLFAENQVFAAPALLLEEVFDPTGAGDTFVGGLTGYLASTNDLSFDNLKRAVIQGSALASFCVEAFGTQRLQTVKPGELVSRVTEFAKISQYQNEPISA
jgi:sugar/nucleoside kinase (ribokinase family)